MYQPIITTFTPKKQDTGGYPAQLKFNITNDDTPFNIGFDLKQ